MGKKFGLKVFGILIVIGIVASCTALYSSMAVKNGVSGGGGVEPSSVILEVNGIKWIRSVIDEPLPVIITVVNIENSTITLEELVIAKDGKVLSRIPLFDTLAGVSEEYFKMKEITEQGEEQALKQMDELERLEKIVSKGRKDEKVYLDIKNITTQTVPDKKLLFNVSLFYESQGKKYVKSITYTIEILEPFPFPPVPKDAEHSRWFAGDVHIHSNYTDCDPWPYYGTLTIPEIKTNAISAGMNWTVITDHAYCLNLTTYEQIKQETTSVSDSTYACLFGEELSVRELKINDSVCEYVDQDTAHFGGIGIDNFVNCTVDTFRQASSPSSQEGIIQLQSSILGNGLAIINHPAGVAWDFSWDAYDCAIGENGIEIINKNWDNTDNGAVYGWLHQRLLKGYKSYAFGGSDTEYYNDIGATYTVVYANLPTQSDIESTLKSGKTFVSTHPGLAIYVKPSSGATWTWMGDTLYMSGGGYVDIFVGYNTGSGRSMNITAAKGVVGQTSVSIIDSRIVNESGSYVLTEYVSGGQTTFFGARGVDIANDNWRAYTTPVWVES